MSYFPDTIPIFARTLAELRDADEAVAVVGHLRPDGDCIGSQVALCRILRDSGIDAVAISEHAVPRNLRTFVGDTPILQASEVEHWPPRAVFVDCAGHDRCGERIQQRYPQVALCVDHHVSNQGFAVTNIIDSKAAATAEILAGLFIDCELPIDTVSAQALYVGIATDTGQFRFPSTTPRVFELASAMLARGADCGAASLELYERESFARMRLLQAYLSSLSLECDGRLCIGMIDDAVYAETGADSEDTEGMVDYARSIDGVDVGVLLEERGDRIKGSLRAKDALVRVDQIAAQFGGGGHACAAGFNCAGSLKEFRPQLVEAVAQQLKSAGI